MNYKYVLYVRKLKEILKHNFYLFSKRGASECEKKKPYILEAFKDLTVLKLANHVC